jgi:DNA-binding transcriptional ArsR family regulator
MTQPPLSQLTQVHKALGHPARLRVLAMLRGGDLCVCQLTAVLGMAPSTVSAHLADLRLAGLVVERKEGRWVHYRLATDPAVAGGALESVWQGLEGDPQVLGDREILQRLRAVPVVELCRAQLDLEKLGIQGSGTLNGANERVRAVPDGVGGWVHGAGRVAG